jgi:HSP20 family protein
MVLGERPTLSAEEGRVAMAIVRRPWTGLDTPDLWRRLFSEEWDVDSWLKVEEFRDGDELVVRVELPDVDPDNDVDLTVEDGVLKLRAEHKMSSEHKEKDTYRSEFRYGVFTRSIPMPAGAKEDDVKASYKDGILQIRVPVGAEVKPPVTKVPIGKT